jgi:hypothetical protein
MGSSTSVIAKLLPTSKPTGGIGWRLTRYDYNKWLTQDVSKVEAYNWYGVYNLQILPPFQYAPGPPSSFYAWYKQFCFQTSDDPDPEFYPAWSWNDYVFMARWFLQSGNPTTPRIFDSILVKKQESSINEMEKLVLAQLVFTIHILMADIRKTALALNQLIGYYPENSPDNQWTVFPQDWKWTQKQIFMLQALDSDLLDDHTEKNAIQHIASLLPGPTFYAPPPDAVRVAIIVYWNNYFTYQTNALMPESQDAISKMNWFPPGAEVLLKAWFKQTFHELATIAEKVAKPKVASSIIREPFKDWISTFCARVGSDIHSICGEMFGNPDAWDSAWPKALVYNITLGIQMKEDYFKKPAKSEVGVSYGFLLESDVLGFWPMPTPIQTEALLKLIPPFMSDGKFNKNALIQLESSQLPILTSCLRFDGQLDGFFPLTLDIGSEYRRGINVTDLLTLARSDSKVMQVFGKVIGMLMPYALGLKRRIAGRERPQWAWTENGVSEIPPYSGKEQHEECIKKAYREGIDTETEMDIECVLEDLPAWLEPWNLKGQELEDYLDAKAPMPGIRKKADLEDDYEYTRGKKRSVNAYHEWRKIITDNPIKLKEFPIATSKTDKNGNEYDNWYPNLKLWQYGEPTGGQLFVKFMTSPVEYITGKSAWDQLFALADKILEFIRVQFKKLTNELPEGWQYKVLLPIVLGVAVIAAAASAGKTIADKV